MTASLARRVGVRGVARRLYAYAFLDDFILLYPFYALLFAETLSVGQISTLFVVWSATVILAEVPSGALADVFSRRALLVAAPLVTGVGYALWTVTPSYLAFAAGFVLWGAGSALRSGAREALVYEELDRLGAADRYATVMGRARALAVVAVMAATAVASPVMAVGGYTAVGVASVAACLLDAAVALTFPEHRPPAARRGGRRAGSALRLSGYVATLRVGFGEVRSARAVRLAGLVLVAVTVAHGALEEYVPLLAATTGVTEATVPWLVLVVTVGTVAGGLLGGVGARLGTRPLALCLAVAAAALGLGALAGHPAGFAVIAVGFAGFQMATVAADARLQAAIAGPARATVTSLAGLGTEVGQVGMFAAYGVLATWAGDRAAFAVSALPFLLGAVVVAAGRPARRRGLAAPDASTAAPATHGAA
ncbi:MAG: MFS transporter [Micromonosporaceae bacterium]